MPVSDVGNIAPILHEVVRLQPSSIVELGIGFGKYGVLCREVLDAVRGRVSGGTLINGIEGYAAYRNPAWNVYDRVTIADFTKQVIVGWDLVLMVDSLEHLEKDKALDFLRYLVDNNNHVIVSVPIGHCPQGAAFGNEYERHRSQWGGWGLDFAEFRPRTLYRGVCLVVSIEGKAAKC